MFACLFLYSWCTKKRGVDSFISLYGTNQELELLALDPYQCEQAELTVSDLAVKKQISSLFPSCGAEVMLSPFPSCAGHQRSHKVCLCVSSTGGMGEAGRPPSQQCALPW